MDSTNYGSKIFEKNFFGKFHEAQNLNLLWAGNYLHSIYIVLAIIYIVWDIIYIVWDII